MSLRSHNSGFSMMNRMMMHPLLRSSTVQGLSLLPPSHLLIYGVDNVSDYMTGLSSEEQEFSTDVSSNPKRRYSR